MTQMRYPSSAINALPVMERPVRFSVACNFDPALIDAVASHPVYEVFGKRTSDFFGGGRPSFYLPSAGKGQVESYVKRAHRRNQGEQGEFAPQRPRWRAMSATSW